MRKIFLFLTLVSFIQAQDKKAPGIYDFSAKTIDGKELALKDYQGKVLLIVNTASKCGLTGQYKGLQKLHNEYSKQGLVILGFPCNQFGKQEPGTLTEIKQFCDKNYGVSFQMMAKVKVNGDDAHPLYKFLKENADGKGKIPWNFTKFLISTDGKTIKRFKPRQKPDSLSKEIENLLQK